MLNVVCSCNFVGPRPQRWCVTGARCKQSNSATFLLLSQLSLVRLVSFAGASNGPPRWPQCKNKLPFSTPLHVMPFFQAQTSSHSWAWSKCYMCQLFFRTAITTRLYSRVGDLWRSHPPSQLHHSCFDRTNERAL